MVRAWVEPLNIYIRVYASIRVYSLYTQYSWKTWVRVLVGKLYIAMYTHRPMYYVHPYALYTRYSEDICGNISFRQLHCTPQYYILYIYTTTYCIHTPMHTKIQYDFIKLFFYIQKFQSVLTFIP